MIIVQMQSSRGALQERCSANMRQTYRRTTMQKRNFNKSRFATLLKSHPRTDRPPKICSTSTEHPPLGQHLRGTTSACQKKFKGRNL